MTALKLSSVRLVIEEELLELVEHEIEIVPRPWL
jgi:hypothetical protein